MESEFEYLSGFIRNYRLAKNESLQSLADRSGVSRSMINQIESNKTSPTLNVLAKLAHAMEIKLGDLIQPPDQIFKAIITQPNKDNIISKPKSPFVSHLLSNSNGQGSEIQRFYFQKQGKTSFNANTKGAQKSIWLETGSLTIYIAGKTYFVGEKTMITINASVPHRFECHSEDLASGLFIINFNY